MATCTEITADMFATDQTGIGFNVGMLGGADADQGSLQFYPPMGQTITGMIDLSAAENSNYMNCTSCVLILEDIDANSGAPAKTFFQQSGMMDLGTTTSDYPTGTMTDVTLIEVTIDPSSYESTPVPGGACYHIANASFMITPPPPVPPEWTCDPAFWADGSCDCGCGALDFECADATKASCDYCDDPAGTGFTGSCDTVACTDAMSKIDPTNNAVCTPAP